MSYLKLILIIFCLALINPLQSQTRDSAGSLSGRIIMPQIKQEKRTFRGRMYRNRLSTSKKSTSESKALKSPFIDVIVVMNPLTVKAQTQPIKGVRIIQKGAEFIPRVVPVTRNSVVEFINYDKFYHNVFSVTPGAKFNLGRRPTGTVVKHKIERSGEIKLFCDIHAQMNAVILSLDTPFFTRTQPNGTYKLENIPAGDYLVEVYHPNLTNTEAQITIVAGKDTKRSFTLSR
jgi:plastocyanin